MLITTWEGMPSALADTQHNQRKIALTTCLMKWRKITETGQQVWTVQVTPVKKIWATCHPQAICQFWDLSFKGLKAGKGRCLFGRSKTWCWCLAPRPETLWEASPKQECVKVAQTPWDQGNLKGHERTHTVWQFLDWISSGFRNKPLKNCLSKHCSKPFLYISCFLFLCFRWL